MCACTTGVVRASLSCCAAVVQVLCALFVCFLKADTLLDKQTSYLEDQG